MPEPLPPPPLSALDSSGRGLRVRFVWVGDRFGHIVERIDGSKVTPELTSIESDAEAHWPDSPPVQQLSVEPVGTTIAALGVGAAARSHWSISIQPNNRDGMPALQFDVAARSSDSPEFLGSRYKRSGNSLTVEPLPEIASTDLEQTAEAIELRPATSGQQTVRWAYRIA